MSGRSAGKASLSGFGVTSAGSTGLQVKAREPPLYAASRSSPRYRSGRSGPGVRAVVTARLGGGSDVPPRGCRGWRGRGRAGCAGSVRRCDTEPGAVLGCSAGAELGLVYPAVHRRVPPRAGCRGVVAGLRRRGWCIQACGSHGFTQLTIFQPGRSLMVDTTVNHRKGLAGRTECTECADRGPSPRRRPVRIRRHGGT